MRGSRIHLPCNRTTVKSSCIRRRKPSQHLSLKHSIHAHSYPYPGKPSARVRCVAMKRRLMDILACPIDKHHPLALLVCSECRRWYTIMDEIPQLLPDDLREQREELSWLSKWKDNAPPQVLREGKPFNLQLSR